MSQSKKAAKSVALIIALGLAGKFLGFIREMLIGAKFGSGIEMDTYVVSLSSIALFSVLITRTINTTMIPVLAEVENSEGKEGKITHTNNLLNIVSLFSTIVILFAFLLAPKIIKIVAPGFETSQQLVLAVTLMRIGLPAIFVSGIQGVLRGFLQTEGNFTETAASSFPVNFIYILFLLFLPNVLGIKGLMVTSVLASISQVILQIYGIKKCSYKYEFCIDFRDKYIRKIVLLIPPILASVGINDLNSIIDKAMASTLVEGSISALNYASKLDNLVYVVFITAISTVVYPIISKEASEQNYSGIKNITIRAINIVLLITIPATIGMIVLAYPITKLIFQRGVFDETATLMTSSALLFTVIGMVGYSTKSIMNDVYYSLQDTKTPVLNSLIAVIINVIFNILLIKPMKHMGLALATSISGLSLPLLSVMGLRKKLGPFGFLKSIKVGIKALLASFVMGVVVYISYKAFNVLGMGKLTELIALLASIGIGGFVYFILIYLFRIEEVNWVIKLVKEKLKSLM